MNITGYGVLEWDGHRPRVCEAGVIRRKFTRLAHGAIEGNPRPAWPRSLAAFCPAEMALEQLYSHYKRPRTAILMGHARA